MHSIIKLSTKFGIIVLKIFKQKVLSNLSIDFTLGK